MPFKTEHGSATGLLAAATAAGRADARRYQMERTDRLTRAATAVSMQRDELRVREKALGLQTAVGIRSQEFRQEELGFKKRSMTLAEKRERRIETMTAGKQAATAAGVGEALSFLDDEKASGRLDEQAYRTMRVGILTGSKSLVAEGVRRHTKLRTADEKARAKAVEGIQKQHLIINDPKASVTQKTAAALNVTNAQSAGFDRWGEGWQDKPFEFYAPDFAKLQVPSRETQRIAAKPLPYDRKDLKTGQVYQLPDGRLGSWTGSRFRIVGEPSAKTK